MQMSCDSKSCPIFFKKHDYICGVINHYLNPVCSLLGFSLKLNRARSPFCSLYVTNVINVFDYSSSALNAFRGISNA